MRFTIALVLCLGVAHADHMSTLKELTPMLQNFNIPTPWVPGWKPSDRRLQEDMTVPAGCLTACPGAQAFADDMMAFSKKAEADGGLGSDMSDVAAVEKALLDLYGEMFNMICKHKDALKCMAKETACGMGSRRLQGSENPFDTFGPAAECFCTICPALKEAFPKFLATFTGMILSAMSVKDYVPDEAKLMAGMCPLVGAGKCLNDNPTECAAMLGEEDKDASSMGFGDIMELEPNCTKAGLITPPAKIEIELTFAGLDYDKLDNDTKTKMTSSIKDNFLKKLGKGYTKDHIKVTLSKGSVKAKVEITPLMSSSSADLKKAVTAAKDEVSTAVATDIAADANIDKYLETGMTKADIKGTAAAPKTGATGSQAGGADKAGASVFLAMLGLVVGSATM